MTLIWIIIKSLMILICFVLNIFKFYLLTKFSTFVSIGTYAILIDLPFFPFSGTMQKMVGEVDTRTASRKAEAVQPQVASKSKEEPLR